MFIEKEPEEKDSLAIYLEQISKYPLLTRKGEHDLGKEIHDCRKNLKELENQRSENIMSKKDFIILKDLYESRMNKAKHNMITSNLRLVVSIAKRHQFKGLGFIDLIDEGNLGLMEAVERYDYTKGCKFSTYGTWWIQQAIIKALADKGRPIRIPIHALNLIKKYYSAFRLLTQELGRKPHVEELADYMNVTKEKINQIVYISQDTCSLDITVDDENLTSFIDFICSDDYSCPFESAFFTNLQNLVKENIKKLQNREKEILQLRYGLDGEGPLTLEKIGKRYGITRERVRQIQNNAIKKLRNFQPIQELKDTLH